jgi:hypothetical protein
MRRYLSGAAAAGLLAVAVGVAAQEPQPYPQSPSQPRSPAAQELKATVTVEGCLMREQDVPGRKPNIAERAGVLEDYILTNTKVIKGSAPQAGAGQARPGEATGTSGTTSPMYDVKGIADEQLKPLVGKRVQIDGAFADVSKSPSAGATEDLADIRGTAIRSATGECPAK